MTIRRTRAAPPAAAPAPAAPSPTSPAIADSGVDQGPPGPDLGTALEPPPGWYSGPWSILAGIDSLEFHSHLRPGEVIRHASGTVVLTCPLCHALQFGVAKIQGTDDRPTLDCALQCGAGHCRRCGVWFTLRDGVALFVAAPTAPKEVKLPERLERAGVHPPPRQPA